MLRSLRTVLAVLLGGALLVAVPATPDVADAAPAVEVVSRTAAVRAPASGRDALVARIRALPHVVGVREVGSGVTRDFVVRFRQPVDHTRPRGRTFVQRVTLIHRGERRPTVLVTAGYGISSRPRESEPTSLLGANQVTVEHRFSSPSRPRKPHWRRQLTIRQAAADHHAVVRSFRQLYPRRWISTGGSKSGMAATYFRRFHPGDVDATIAYVAPNDVVEDVDAYNDFLDRVGTAACRDAITANQRRALGTDRAWFLERTRRAARELGTGWSIVGSSEMAFEAGVVDAFFAFWQYAELSDCADVPGPAASRDQVWRWFERVAPLTFYADRSLRFYVPYYFQATAQLGSPLPYERRLADLLRFPGADVAETFVPAALKPVRRDPSAMRDVDRWVRTKARRIIFVYGGNDPWSAEPFECGTGAARRGCSSYVVPGGNHFAKVADLPRAQRQQVRDRLRRWAGLR